LFYSMNSPLIVLRLCIVRIGSPKVNCMKKMVCGYGGLWNIGTKTTGLSQNSTFFFSLIIFFCKAFYMFWFFLFLFILTNLVRVHVRRCQKLWLGETITNCIPLYNCLSGAKITGFVVIAEIWRDACSLVYRF